MYPRDLPKLRDQTLKHLNDASSPIRANLSADMRPGLDALATHLSQAGMYWVRPDMAALAVAAGSQLAAASWGIDARPSPSGLIVFEDGIGNLDFEGVPCPIDACAWGTFEGECLVWLLMLRRTLLDRAAIIPFYTIDVDGVPPLIPVVAFQLGVETPESMVEMDEERTVLSTLAAALLLMEQPTLVEHGTKRPGKSVRRASVQAGRPNPEVSVVNLRRQYIPQDSDPEPGGSGRQYRHRWVVSGHWRNQAYGPEHALRRRQWQPSYVKGPHGAPLLVTEKVNVWRR